MKNFSFLLLFSSLFLLFSCGQTTGDSTAKTASESDEITLDNLPMNPKYPNIPLAEKGITVTNETGWEAQTKEFHINYCGQMMASLENDIETAFFCECFIEKIQYYYPPIHFKEAYEDQSRWNSLCYQAATDAKK